MKGVKNILSGLILLISSNTLAQPVPERLVFVFVDSEGHLILPDITIKSNTVFNEMVYAEPVHITKNIPNDSCEFSCTQIVDSSLHIYSLNAGFVLDLEYYLRIAYQNQVMHVNLLNLGNLVNDTIVFQPGQFIYLQKPIPYELSGLISCNSSLIEYEKTLPADLCLFNCKGESDTLNTHWVNSIRTKDGGEYFGYRGFLYLNDVPFGYAVIDEREKLNKIFYFDSTFVDILKIYSW